MINHFSRADGLRARILILLALGSVVFRKSAMKTSLISDAFGPFSGCELREGDGIMSMALGSEVG